MRTMPFFVLGGLAVLAFIAIATVGEIAIAHAFGYHVCAWSGSHGLIFCKR